MLPLHASSKVVFLSIIMAAGRLSGCFSVIFVLLCVGHVIWSREQTESATRSYNGTRAYKLSPEKALIGDLYRRYAEYGTDGRPVRNVSQPVIVQFGLGLIKMELLEKENMLFLSTWARYRWRDEYLQWDPEQYDGVSNVKVTYNRIWIPDVMLYNTAMPDEIQRKVKVVIEHDGTVTWYPHRIYRSSCAVDVRNFPFDNQTCYLWFGSWTHPFSELDVQLAFPEGIDLSTFQSVYKDASEWEIFNHTAERMILPEEGSPQYAILSFTLRLQRKLMFSTYILTMPAIFLSFLTLLVFWLPPEDADKSALGLTIFGSVLLLLLILVEAAPPTASAVPLLGVYYCFTTVIVIVSIFLSSLVLKVGKAGSDYRPVPKWANVIFVKGLARVLFVKTSAKGCLSTCGREPEFCGVDNQLDQTEAYHVTENLSTRDSVDEATPNGLHLASFRQLEEQLKAIHKLMTDVVCRQKDKERTQTFKQAIDKEWRMLAIILDRLFFFIYLIVIILSLIFLFPKSHY